MSLNHPCPLLRNIYDMLLDEWYEDQHFDSPLLDQIRQIEKAHNGKSIAVSGGNLVQIFNRIT